MQSTKQLRLKGYPLGKVLDGGHAVHLLEDGVLRKVPVDEVRLIEERRGVHQKLPVELLLQVFRGRASLWPLLDFSDHL